MEDLGDDETFADATDPVITHKRALPPGAMYAPGEAVPEKRLNMKGTMRMKKRASSPSGEAQASRPNPGNSVTEVDEALVVEKGVPRSIIKQNDKEIKWEDIPPIERELYHEAEAKQWKEHLHYEAVRVHPPEDAALLRQKVPRERILRARFAYRDKNAAKRRENPDTPPKAKARLCIGGHLDPDLQKGQVKTEAPTASKMALPHSLVFGSSTWLAIGSWGCGSRLPQRSRVKKGALLRTTSQRVTWGGRGLIDRDHQGRLWIIKFTKVVVAKAGFRIA